MSKHWLLLSLLLLCASLSYGDEPKKVITYREGEFKRSRILGDPYAAINRGKEKLLDKTSKEYATAQKSLEDTVSRLEGKITDLEQRVPTHPAVPVPTPTEPAAAASSSLGQPTTVSEEPVDMRPKPVVRRRAMIPHLEGHEITPPKGPAIISFPVQGSDKKERTEIVLPAGSYVKGKMLTGVEAPEGTPYPVLLQLDYAHILPNKKSLDLTGCFMIAKAQGDLSTERVQMQATKLSCVARDGHMFEREVNGFVADDQDNSFAVIGSVNTKQDRVAAMAFLSSIVEGVGRAVQMAQTSEQTSAEGTSRRMLTGDQGRYIAAGGAAQAAGMVAQWYLKQAQNLLPTINVGSGRDIWIVMSDSVALPNTYFRKNKLGASHEQDYSFVSRLLDY